MNRGQYIALFIVFLAGGAFISVNVLSDEAATPVVDAALAGAVAEETGDQGPEEAAPPATSVAAAPPLLGEARDDLTNLDGWLQTDATGFADFDGTVRVVQFWTFSCINCKRTLDNLGALYDEFHPRGLEVIGVHAPEFDFEKDVDSIQQAAIDLGVVWPIALDTEKTNFRSWQEGRRFWPRTFVLDQNGQIRFDRIGEGGYDELNATVSYLIENGP